MLIRPNTKSYKQEWRVFFKVNCNALFQTALLLTADTVIAELALTKGIEELNISSSPGQTSLAAWERAVVIRSIETARLSSPAPDSMVRVMLQPGLQPVIEIERLPRICFVLRILLGYSTAVCAQMLGMEASGILMLFQMAAIQLQQKVVASRVQT